MKVLTKYDTTEPIQVGDLISYTRFGNSVTRSVINHFEDTNNVVGVCVKIDDDNIYIENQGMVDVNVTGIVCIGDKLQPSNIPGKAKAIKYNQDETHYKMRSIGKCICLYNSYDTIKALLDIE